MTEDARQKEILEAEEAVRALASEMAGATTVAGEVQEIRDSLQEARQAVARSAADLGAARVQLDELRGPLGDLTTRLNTVAKAVEDSPKEMRETITSEIAWINPRLDEIESRVQRGIDSSAEAIKETSAALDAAASGIEENVSRGAASTDSRIEGLEHKLEDSLSSLRKRNTMTLAILVVAFLVSGASLILALVGS